MAAALPLSAQQEPAPRKLPQPQEFVTTQEESLFSLVRSQEDVHQWEAALEDLEKGDHRAAAERLHRLLRTDSGGTAAIGTNRFIGLRHAVVMTLANLPPAGQAAYEELVEREAGRLYQSRAVDLLDEQLRLLAERFPAASIGRAARLRLGDLALERGDGLSAQVHFDAALAAVPIGSDLERAVLARQQCANAMVRAPALRASKTLPAAMSEVLAALPEAQDRTDWPAYGGGSDGARQMTEPLGMPRPQWNDNVAAPGFDDDGRGSGNYAMQLVGGIDGLFVNTGLEVIAVDPLAGRLSWSSPSPLREQTDNRQLREYLDSVNEDMVLAPALGDDIVVAAVQVPDDSSLVRYQNAFTIMHRIPERRLFAFQRSTGKLLWSHFDRLEGPVTARFRGHSSCGPPLIVGDTVYAPVHDRSGAIAFYVGAYDLHTGQPRWRRLVCSSQQEVNMFGNARMEFAAGPICSHDGLLLGTSNLGVCYALERETGRVRWITSYDVIRMPPAALQGQEARPVRFQNSAPAVTDGVLCCTPLDSDFVLGIEARDGTPLWRVPYEAHVGRTNNDVRWLCGAIDDEFVLAGRGIVAVKARPSRQTGQVPPLRQIRAEPDAIDEEHDPPRPAIAGDAIWLPTSSGIEVVDKNGTVRPMQNRPRLEAPGCMLLVDGFVASVCNRTLEVLFDADAMRQKAESMLREVGDDPAAILRLCALRAGLAADADPAAQEPLYRRGLQACVSRGLPKEHPLHAAFLQRLFELALARGENARGSRGEQDLLAAREVAPNKTSFLRAESLILERIGDDPTKLAKELDLLLERAGDETFALPGAGGELPVRAYVLWRRAQLATEPAQQVEMWQSLLSLHGEATIRHESAAMLAQREIAALIERHGRGVYAAIEQRAAAMLAQAGTAADALLAVGAAFPHSDAAVTARSRLLDVAVQKGDLGTAVDMFALAARDGVAAPTLVRRVIEAAMRRGNTAFAIALCDRLVGVETASDWPDDGGKALSAVADELRTRLRASTPALPQPVAPAEVLAELPNPMQQFMQRRLPTSVDPSFGVDPALPLYVACDDQVRAIDVGDPQRKVLFTYKAGIVTESWICGHTIVLPNLDHIVGLESRTGTLQWQFAAPGRILICHGIVRGVLHVTQRGNNDDVTIIGIEPLTGRTLFARPLAGGAPGAQSKPTESDLLTLQVHDDRDPEVVRVDPLTGAPGATFRLGPQVREAAQVPVEALRSAVLLQLFSATSELLFVPIDSSLSNGPPRLLAVRADGSVAWRFEGTRGCRLVMTALRGGRMLVLESSNPGGGRAVVLDASTGAQLREVATGAVVATLNWQRSRGASIAPPALLLGDVDATTGDRRLVCVPVEDDFPAFVRTIGGNGEELMQTATITPELLLFGVHSPRTQGPVRIYALRTADRTSALPDGRAYLQPSIPPRQGHEMVAVGAYTAIVTESRVYVLGDGKERR